MRRNIVQNAGTVFHCFLLQIPGSLQSCSQSFSAVKRSGSLQQHHEGSVLVHDTLHLQLNDARESLSNNIWQKRRFIQGRKLGYHPCCGSGIDFPSTHGKFHSWRRLQNTRFTVVRMDVLHLFGGGLYHAADHHAPALQGDWESDIQLCRTSRPVSFLLYSELDQSVGRKGCVWMISYTTEGRAFNWIVWISGIVQTILYCDFFYYYAISKWFGKKMSLPT